MAGAGQLGAPAGRSPVGQLISVNVGLPEDVAWQGRTVHTGVWKYPVQGPAMVRTLNIDGDGQGDVGGHGGPHRAVLVYQRASYDYWQQELGRDDFSLGQFGENFTVAGLADADVCIGDRYQIGEALFEVSAPRVTCYRVGMRLGEPRLPALLVSHHRPGFYLRVLREGIVRAGDPIYQVATGPGRMTVAEVDALLYLPGHDRAGMERALGIEALSPGWKGSFTALLAEPIGTSGNVGLTEAAGASPVAWPGFRQLQVAATTSESPSVLSVNLASVDGSALPPALPGQFVAVRLAIGDAQRTTVRSYSLSGAAGSPEYRISVKREPGGVVSGDIHAHLRAGAIVEVAAPRGTFVLQDSVTPVLLVSAGIGVTPVLAMLSALAAEPSDRQIWWLQGLRNSADHPFAEQVRSLLGRLANVRAEICYSTPLPADRVGVDYDHRGRLDAELLQQLDLPRDATAYICGPDRFMDDIRAALTGVGLQQKDIRTELFGARPAVTPGIAAATATPPHPPAGAPGAGPLVAFARSGLSVPWREDAASLLEFAESCDVPTQWSCRTGICHTCEVGLLAGSVTYDPDPIDLPAAGNVLVCCATPREEITIDL